MSRRSGAGFYLIDRRMLLVAPELAAACALGLRRAIEDRRREALPPVAEWAEALVVLDAEMGAPSVVGTRDAAARLGVTDSRVRQWCRSGGLSARRVGRSWLVDAEAIEQMAEERRRNA